MGHDGAGGDDAVDGGAGARRALITDDNGHFFKAKVRQRYVIGDQRPNHHLHPPPFPRITASASSRAALGLSNLAQWRLMLTVSASHSFDLMVGEPVAYVQGLPKGHGADLVRLLTPRSPVRIKGDAESGGGPLSFFLTGENLCPLAQNIRSAARLYVGRGAMSCDVTPNYHPVLIRASALFLPKWAGEARGCVA